jgi:hypothetical protein
MTEVLNNAGALGYLIMGGTALGVLAAAALAGLAFTRRRVPLFALIVFPYLVLAAGAFGAWVASATAGSVVAQAAPDAVASMAMSQAWASMAVDWVARWGASLVLCAGVWSAAVGSAVVPGEEPRFTFMASGLAAATAVGGAIALLGYGIATSFASSIAIAGLVLVVGLGVAVAALRRAADDDMFRVAGMRFAASMCAVFSIYHAARAIEIGNRMVAFDSNSKLMTTLDILEAIKIYDELIWPGMAIGITAILVGLLLAFHGFFTEVAEIAVKYTVVDSFLVVVALVGVGFFRLLENSGFDGLYTVAMNGPAVEAYHEMAGNLPSSLVPAGDSTVVARMAEGGFGDVLVLGQKWVRTAKWTGSSWEEVHEDLADVKDLSDRPPLLAIARPDPAAQLFEVLDRVKDGKAFILLRAAEVKPGVTVPPELARLQVTFLPIQLGAPALRDHTTHVWVEAGSPEAMFGPIVWFGEGDEALDAIDYATSARTATGSPGVHVLASDRKVGDVVNTCMNYLLDKSESTVSFATDRWCTVSNEEPDVLIKEAAAVVPVPNPDNVKLELEIEGPLTLAEVDEQVRREMGALSFCATKAVTPDPAAPAGSPPPEELKGRMDLILAVGKEGDVYDTVVDEKSKVQSPAILRCAAKRFRRLSFTLPPPVPPVPVEPGAKPPPPPTPPKVLVHLDFPTP